MSSRDSGFPVFSIVYGIFAIPFNFLFGFIVGLVAPVAAIAAVVAGIRLLTNKVPFLTPVESEGGERMLTLRLVPEEEVGPLFEEQKELIGGDIVKMRDEIQAIVQQARTEAQAPGQEDVVIEVQV